jgi:hypothetical protein
VPKGRGTAASAHHLPVCAHYKPTYSTNTRARRHKQSKVHDMTPDSQQDADRETRFAHLMNPIRDWADNWHGCRPCCQQSSWSNCTKFRSSSDTHAGLMQHTLQTMMTRQASQGDRQNSTVKVFSNYFKVGHYYTQRRTSSHHGCHPAK